MSEHTPGPWKVRYDLGQGAPQFEIMNKHSALPVAVACSYCKQPSEANAQLIAAAPELLEACKMALLNLNGSGFSDERDQLHKAITKATGAT